MQALLLDSQHTQSLRDTLFDWLRNYAGSTRSKCKLDPSHDEQQEIERRILECRDLICGLRTDHSNEKNQRILDWLQNEGVEIRALVLEKCEYIHAEIEKHTDERVRLRDEFLRDWRTITSGESAPSPPSLLCTIIPPGLKHSTNTSLSTMFSNKVALKDKRLNEWRLAKEAKKAATQAKLEQDRTLALLLRKQSEEERVARRKIVEEYRAQRQEEARSESHAAVTQRMEEMEIRRMQFVSLGIGDRIRERAFKFLEKRKVQQPKTTCTFPLIGTIRRASSIPRPSRLYHPTKSSLNHTAKDFGDTTVSTTSTVFSFTPFLSRYSMTNRVNM